MRKLHTWITESSISLCFPNIMVLRIFYQYGISYQFLETKYLRVKLIPSAVDTWVSEIKEYLLILDLTISELFLI